MAPSILALFSLVKNTDKVNSHLKTEAILMVNFTTTIFKEKGHTSGQMAGSTKETGIITK